jgi:soluble lytic murein transglycosylase-like protein
MARIPDITPSFESLANPPVPVSDRPIVATDLSAPAQAIKQAGAEGVDVANQAIDMQGKTDVAFAKSNYLTAMIQAQKNEENNPDWQGAPQRWQDAAKTAYDASLEGITNPRFKAQFAAEAGFDTRYQYQNFLQQVDMKRKQDGLGKTTQAVQNNMTSALAAPDDETAATIINNTNDLLKGATANGFITPQQEIEERNKWIQQYGKSKIEQMQQSGDAEGAKDWFNRHYNLLNPTPQDVNQINAAVTIPRATSTTDRIVAGASMANPQALADAQEQMESGGQQSAVSSKGALGVMQLMPAAAQDAAMKLGVPYDPERLKNDEVYNRMLGNEYRNEMIARYSGNQTLALAAYNAGPRSVDKWIKQFGNPNTGEISNADFIAKIPFKETRNYVTAINAKAPPIPGVPLDAQDPEKSHQAWLETANNMPPSISQLVNTGIQTRINAGEQQRIDTQTAASSTMTNPILQGKITDPSQLQAPEMQTAWANANPELQKAVLGGLKEQNKESTEFGPKFWDLYKGVHAPDGDPSKITNPTQFYKYGDGNGLTLKGIQQLSSEIDGKKTAEGAQKAAMEAQTFKVLKTQLSGEDLFPGMKDPKGEEIFAQAMPMVYKAIQDGESKGIPASELYSPSSKNWVGNVAKGLIRPPDQWHADIVGSNLQDEAAPTGGMMSSVSRWLNSFDNSIETEARQGVIEKAFKDGKYSTDETKPQGLAVLKKAVADNNITKEKFMELAVKYGYAQGGK